MTELLLNRSRRNDRLGLDSVLTLLLSVVSALVALVIATRLARSDALEWFLPVIFIVLSSGFAFVALQHYFGQERIELDGGRVRILRELGPFKRQWSARLEDILGFEVPALGREFVQHSWGVGKPSLLVRTRHGVFRCCVGVPPGEAQQVGAAVWKAAQRIGRPPNDEMQRTSHA
jgi:hypothetical protein